jgi:iron complex outermembrane receptor protein
MVHTRLVVFLLVLCCPAISGAARSEDQSPQAQDLKRLSIEELASVDVTSVSRRPERISQTAAAVSVVRNEDIHRAGVLILAEAMRLADAVDVARVNGGAWGVSARGFNINTANKLLVLVDGRSTYSSLFGGTFWDVQDAFLEDLDRIEVVRGPGGTIWGANAVNGVINIISKPVADTQGAALTLVGGSSDRAIVAGRYGGRAGAGHYRVYGKYRMREPQALLNGTSAHDDVRFGQAGFRVDSSQSGRTRWSLWGDIYRGTNGFPDRPDGDVAGGNFVGRWSRGTPSGEFAIQAFYDRSYRKVPQQFEETRHAGEVDAQQRLTKGRHDLIFGGTARAYRSDDLGTAGFRFEPQVRDGWNVNAFVQDELELVPTRIFVVVGSKFGRNNFTGLEVQPSARIRYQPSAHQMVWAALSRAVRLPTRFDNDIRLLNPATGAIVLTGSDDFQSESVLAIEGGYRILPHPRLSIDAAVYTNRYDDLRSQEFRITPSPIFVLDNQLNARTSGVEIASGVQVAPNWRLHGSYTWLHKTVTFDERSTDPTGGVFEGNDPSHLMSARSYIDLPHGLAFDTVFRFTGRRPAPVVPKYAEVDLRAAWSVRPEWELSIIGQNLLHDCHEELASPNTPPFAFRRSVFARSVWRF